MRIETGWMVRLADGNVGRILSIDEEGIRVELSESVRLVRRSEIRETFRCAESSGKGYAPRQVNLSDELGVIKNGEC